MADEVKTSRRKRYIIAGCVYFGQLIVGFSMAWTIPAFVKLRDPNETPLESAITDVQASWIASISFFGLIGGPYISGCLCNVVGRKPCLYFGGCILLLSYILLAVANSLALIYVARILVGVGSGVLFVTNLVYIGELASTKVRGTLLTLTGFFNTQGILMAYLMGTFNLSYAKMNWMVVFLCVEYLVALFFTVPETAVYLVMKGKREEALVTLTSLVRQDDIDEIENANDKSKSKMAQLTELYTVKSNRIAVFIIISLNIFTQLSGLATVIAFVTVILSGFNMEAYISNIIIGVTQVLAAIIAPVLVDRIGRKILMLASTAGCSLSLAVLGIYFYLYNNGYSVAENLQWLSLVSMIIYCIAYYSGMGIIPNTFIGEMFTDTCRSFGGTFVVSISFMFGFGISTAFGYLLAAWGPSVIFWIFSCACALAFIFTIMIVPETKGKTLLEIQALLSK